MNDDPTDTERIVALLTELLTAAHNIEFTLDSINLRDSTR